MGHVINYSSSSMLHDSTELSCTKKYGPTTLLAHWVEGGEGATKYDELLNNR